MSGGHERRQLHELSSIEAADWNEEELAYHHAVMSELSPWMNAQGSAIHAQVIQEIERRKEKGRPTYDT
ncbi:hypothetical protein [Paenibacillus lutrae]|uniref:Uncharacterized protein n=1 Tax=Paenibacillus lutrae TaxID=2078573 RepID=A0A7X3JZ89_9BACL|nr:hypothetical protein [Paenibacillus lutrae]MVO99784.1 hypothetical protein [Paenibacillus lutrae]